MNLTPTEMKVAADLREKDYSVFASLTDDTPIFLVQGDTIFPVQVFEAAPTTKKSLETGVPFAAYLAENRVRYRRFNAGLGYRDADDPANL